MVTPAFFARCRRLVARAVGVAALLMPLFSWAFAPINLSQGWNLVGNSDAVALDVASQLSGKDILTVWKWNKVNGRWAFYAPGMTATELAAYAASKQYDVLQTIEAKEGFWVNTMAPVTLTDTTGTGAASVVLQASDLAPGWNLVASADNKTPSELISTLQNGLASAGQSIATVWSWDAAAATPGWKFYAPALAAQGAAALTDYIVRKGYSPFTSALTPGQGFWLNVVASTQASTNYLFLAGDSIVFDDGFIPVAYTLAQFQTAPGIAVKWPLYDSAALTFTLTDAGGFSIPAGQTLSAALAITDTAPGSQGTVRFYIDNVAVSQNAAGLTLTVPSAAVAWAYGVAADGSGAALTNLSTTVANSSVTLATAANVTSRLVLGSSLNSAINGVGAAANMTGTYKVTLVVTNLPLALSDGTPLNSYTINVPQSLVNTNVRSITGFGLEGFITLSAR